MLYLVLKRYLEKISLAQKYVLHGNDLCVLRTPSPVDRILDAVFNRTESLKGEYGDLIFSLWS